MTTLEIALGGHPRTRPSLAVLAIVLVAACLLVIAGVSSAAAAERNPFQITRFTMETVRETEEVTEKPGTEITIRRFVNKPYAFTQAGGHPWALTTTVEFSSEKQTVEGQTGDVPTQNVKDVVTNLPPGLLGNPMALPRCPLALILGKSGTFCPASTQVGEAVLFFDDSEEVAPIVNLTPEAGQSAEFGLETAKGITVVLTAHLVRTEQGQSGCATPGGCYGVTVVSNNTPMASELRSAELTFWGVPADPSHDVLRGFQCERIRNGIQVCFGRNGGEPAGVSPVPFLTMPTGCSTGPETATVRADTWQEPGSVNNGQYSEQYKPAITTLPGVTGCSALQFTPQIGVQPDTLLADAPVGLGVSVSVPQFEEPARLATPQLRNAVVTLPEGMSISPGIVDGIQACDESGPEGINFTGPESEETGANGELQLAPGKCPNASTVGEAEAITPLLPEPVKGHVYLARPGCGNAALGQAPCTEQDALDGNLYKLYLELGGEGPLANTGVNIKVAGKTEANPATGQLTTRFLQNPQLPFSELKIHLNGGPRAPLDTPAACGTATTTADFTPWSAPGTTPEGVSMAGTPDATPSSYFNVDLAGDNLATPCPLLPLTPGFTAGTVTPNAGKFSAFTLNFSRQDREQFLKGIQVHTPPGLLGMLASVQLCEEPQAASGHCPEASKIGTTRVASGAGSHPFEISGNVYLTTGYKGAPFGLSIVTDAVAGPFHLGLVVVRSRIDVDPVTSQLTVTSDPLPQIIFGVPLRLQRVTVNIDRPGFMFNPTNCSAQQITVVVSGSQNAVANVASPFAVGGCKSLAFKPSFTVSTSGHTSKANGASLDAKVSYPPGSMGSEANIASVKVELPKQLPSRLTTLQKACTAAQFESNPAGCPPASVIGIVKASTPLLPVGLQGPVYFVSHGGEAFPSLVIVLQGDGVRVDLTAATFISKAGITSSTFKTIPDVPVNSFELYLPEGPYSALAANGNLCSLTATVATKRKVAKKVRGRTVHRTVSVRVHKPVSLTMPSEFVAQNGAIFHQNTSIRVTGCGASTAKKKAKAKKANKAGHGRTRS